MREGYTVPRNDAGELATEQNTGVMQLYKLVSYSGKTTFNRKKNDYVNNDI